MKRGEEQDLWRCGDFRPRVAGPNLLESSLSVFILWLGSLSSLFRRVCCMFNALQVQLNSHNSVTNWSRVSGGLTFTFITKYVLYYYTILSYTYLLYITIAFKP